MKKNIVIILVVIALLVGILSGCTETTTSENNAPVAMFTVEVNETTNTATFTDGSTDADTDDTLTYTWDFGDGETSTYASPEHVYAENGSYTVKLTVTDGTDTDEYSTVVEVNYVAPNEAPVADFTYAADNLTVTFTDASTDDSAIAAWSWDFDEDEIEDSSEQNPEYTFAADGTYNVTLTVTDDDTETPLTHSATKEVTVVQETTEE